MVEGLWTLESDDFVQVQAEPAVYPWRNCLTPLSVIFLFRKVGKWSPEGWSEVMGTKHRAQFLKQSGCPVSDYGLTAEFEAAETGVLVLDPPSQGRCPWAVTFLPEGAVVSSVT